MSSIKRRQMIESQRRNGLNCSVKSNDEPVVESELNYNAQNCQATNMPTNNYVASMPMNLEPIQHENGAEGDQPNVGQGENMSDIINPQSSCSHSGNVSEGSGKAKHQEKLTAVKQENSNVLGKMSRACYDSSMAYQLPYSPSVLNLAKQPPCHNVNCIRCNKATTTTKINSCL